MEYMFCHLLTNQKSIHLVVMETKVSTPVLGLFWKFIVGIRLNHGELISTFYKYDCSTLS